MKTENIFVQWIGKNIESMKNGLFVEQLYIFKTFK